MSAGLWMPQGAHGSRGLYAIILAMVDNFQLNVLLARAWKNFMEQDSELTG